MTNYKEIRTHCRHTQQLTSTIIDDFLIYYAARQNKLNREAEKHLTRYRHILKSLPQEWANMSISQYIAHRIFRRNGLIKTYLNHSGLSHLAEEEMAFLELQKQHPWRFSFAKITGRPDNDFFEMEDVFTGDSCLLYSPGTTDILLSQNINLCFNLIAWNGKCWQTYGPIGAYAGFEPQDILFFATELNHGQWIEDNNELMELVAENPVPYMYLFAGSNMPLVFRDDDQIVQITAEYLDDTFDAEDFRETFRVEYNRGVYKLSQANWSEFPHYSEAYYDEKEELLFLYSMTDRGFYKLIKQLNSCGYELTFEPDVRVNMGMVDTAKKILKKEIELNRYGHLFDKESPEMPPEELDNLNTMLTELIPYINSGDKPDLDKLAADYNQSPESVYELYENLKSKIAGRPKS
jgi:hypothetical protein